MLKINDLVSCGFFGEFEQGLPVMEQIKLQYPEHKIVVTFFSPSGSEVRKNNRLPMSLFIYH